MLFHAPPAAVTSPPPCCSRCPSLTERQKLAKLLFVTPHQLGSWAALLKAVPSRSLPPGRGGAAEAGQGAGHAQPVREQRGHEQLRLRAVGLAGVCLGSVGGGGHLLLRHAEGQPPQQAGPSLGCMEQAPQLRHPCLPCRNPAACPPSRCLPPPPVTLDQPPAPPSHPFGFDAASDALHPFHTPLTPVLLRQHSPRPCRQPPPFGSAPPLGSKCSPQCLCSRPAPGTPVFLSALLPCTPCFSLLAQRCRSLLPSPMPLPPCRRRRRCRDALAAPACRGKRPQLGPPVTCHARRC